jgi:dolichol-phosphate mannosyltransferase
MDSPFLLSLVVPVYFEEECIQQFILETRRELEKHGIRYEIVFVDDGSRDRTVELIAKEIESDPRLRLVQLSYNHGKQAAVTAGIAHTTGDYLLYMDPDLQDPPDEIINFVQKIREGDGYDLVFGVRREKKDRWLNVALSGIFWFTLEKLTSLELPRPLAVMRIFNRKFADKFLEYSEANRFLEGLFMHVGMRRTQIEVSQRPRFAGVSKFNFRRKMKLAFDAIFDYSDLPLRLAMRLGMVMLVLSLLGAMALIVLRTFVLEFQLGWPSLFVALLFGFGLQTFFLGIIGKYVGNIYLETKRRPLFSIKRLYNVPEP